MSLDIEFFYNYLCYRCTSSLTFQLPVEVYLMKAPRLVHLPPLMDMELSPTVSHLQTMSLPCVSPGLHVPMEFLGHGGTQVQLHRVLPSCSNLHVHQQVMSAPSAPHTLQHLLRASFSS